MKKLLIVSILAVTFLSVPVAMANNDDQDVAAAKASLKRAYPNIEPDDMRKTDMDGIYEIMGDGNVAYYHPKTNTLIFGDMVRNGRSLTHERKNELSAKNLKLLPLEKSVRVGKGKKEVIEFSDPDCPYCRKAAEYLAKRTDVTRRVFLFPLSSIHKDARKKSLKVLCSGDGAGEEYKGAMAGKLDSEFKLPDGCEAKMSALLDEHLAWGKKMGVSGTPAFWVNGERVDGYDVARLEQLLADKK